MARKGAPIADIQDVLGHTSDKMARHYAGEARKAAAARADGEAQPCQLDQPVQVEQPATFGLMVLPGLGRQPVGLKRVDFEIRSSATRIRTWNLPVNSRPLYR